MLSILVDYNILLRLAYFFNLWKNEEKHQHKVGRNSLYALRDYLAMNNKEVLLTFALAITFIASLVQKCLKTIQPSSYKTVIIAERSGKQPNCHKGK